MTESAPASFQRERNPHGLGVTTQGNSQLYAATRKGAGLRVIWAAPGNGDGSVSEFRAEGYNIVLPKDCEQMRGGQYAPFDRDFGVYVDVDKKADRVTGRGGMVLMWLTEEEHQEHLAQQQNLSNLWFKKSREASIDQRGSELGNEVTTTNESLSEILK